MLGTFLGSIIMSRKYMFKRGVSFTLVVLFFAFIFLWYSQLTEMPFREGAVFIERTLVNLNRFFLEEVRDEGVQAMLGRDLPLRTTPAKIRFVFSWLTLALIGVGIITLIFKRKEMVLLNSEFQKSYFLKNRFEAEYYVISLICVGICGIIVALPYVSIGYSMDRTYSTVLTILSVFFVIGGIILTLRLKKLTKSLIDLIAQKRKKVTKQKNGIFVHRSSQCCKISNGKNGSESLTYIVILLILTPYYLCVSGVMYNMFGVPRDITLNSEGELYDMLYISDTESYSARWLGSYSEGQQKIYVDGNNVMEVIRSQGGVIPFDRYNRDLLSDKIKGYIYLDNYNVVKGLLHNGHNISECSNIFIEKNKIYDNGESEVWR
jgi:uncharacterized membrane protein